MTVFKDSAQNIPIASGTLPEGFSAEAELDMTRVSVSKFYRFFGQAEDPQHRSRIGFQDGDQFTYPMKMVYSDDPFVSGKRDRNGVMYLEPCDLQEQMLYFVHALTGQSAQPPL